MTRETALRLAGLALLLLAVWAGRWAARRGRG